MENMRGSDVFLWSVCQRLLNITSTESQYNLKRLLLTNIPFTQVAVPVAIPNHYDNLSSNILWTDNIPYPSKTHPVLCRNMRYSQLAKVVSHNGKVAIHPDSLDCIDPNPNPTNNIRTVCKIIQSTEPRNPKSSLDMGIYVCYNG